MRVLELFAGYGSQALALENLGIDFTSDISEIDKYAIQAYEQLHGATHNWGDITKIDETQLPYYDLITYSSPCQDFSVAGLGKGGDAGSGTRSSLLWQCERIIRAVKPKYLLMENVKNLVGERHKHNFIKWLKVLESLGYQNFWKVLNAKDYGVPQNRERVFVVSILGGGQYLFPNPIKLEKRLKDVLENDVDEMYYLSDKLIKGFLARAERKDTYVIEPNVLTPKRTEYGKQIRKDYESGAIKESRHNMTVLEPQVVGGVGEKSFGNQYRQGNRIYSSNAISPTLIANSGNASGGSVLINEPIALDEQNKCIRYDGTVGTLTTDGSSPKHNNRVIEPLRIREATQKGYAEAYDGDSVTLDEPNSQTRRGRVGKQMSNTLTTSCNIGVVQVGNIVHTGNWDNPERGRIYSDEGVSPALSTMQGGGLEPKRMCYDIPQTVTVRKNEVDINEFVRQLRGHKKKVGMSNKQIAESLNLPLTMVEHWFRTDNCFSVPDKDIWFKLKQLLKFELSDYDAFVTEFEEREGTFEKANRCYGTEGIAPTMTAASSDEKIIHQYRIRKLTPRECWRLMGVKDEQFDKLHDISNTQLYKLAGNSIVVDVMMGIFRNLLLSDERTNGQLTLI